MTRRCGSTASRASTSRRDASSSSSATSRSRLKPGEIVALVGQSGAGKSSLLHIAGLLEEPTSGEVYIDGQAASHLPERARTEMRRETLGFVYQFHHLLPEFTALENVAMPRRIAGESRDEAAEGSDAAC